MKRLLAVLLAICLLASLAACTQSEPSTSSAGGDTPSATESKEESTPPASDVTIRFWQAGGDTAGAADIMNELLTKFTEETGIKVEYQAYPWANDPHVTFQTSITGGDVADLLIVGSPFDWVLAGSGQLLALDDYIEEDIKNDLMGVFANECVYEGEGDLSGKYISMPLYGDARTIFYNKAIFDEAGVEYPEESWTHEEFIEAARKLTGTYGGKQVYGFGTSASLSSQYLPFIWNYGGNILNEDNTAPGTDTEEWRKGIEDFMVLFNEGLVPPGSEAISLADILTMFMNGEVAMMIGTSDYATQIRNSEDFDTENFGVGIMPHEEYQTAYAGADVFVIPAISEHPEEAAQLINFMLRTENQLEYAKTVGFFPAVQSAAEDTYYSEDPIRAAFADAVNHGRFYVKTSYSGGVTPILSATIQEFIAGTTDIDGYQQSLTDQLKALIAEQEE